MDSIAKLVKAIAILLFAAVIAMLAWDWMHPDAAVNLPAAKEPLKQDEAVRIVTQGPNVTVVTKKGSDSHYIPPKGSSVVTVKNDGSVITTIKDKGLELGVGGSFFYADSARIGLDLGIAYWKRLGLHVGLGFGAKPVALPYLAASYRLDQLGLNNTSLISGITAQKRLLVGLRVEF